MSEQNRPLDIWCCTPSSSRGWASITNLADLAGRLFHSPPTYFHPQREYGRVRKVVSLLPQVRRPGRSLLLIAAQPGDLLQLASARLLSGRYEQVGVWIIDSFWDERIPRFARTTGHIDHLWVMDGDLTEQYSDRMHREARWAPIGSDALRLLSEPQLERDIDLLRFGRQPPALDDDAANRAAASAHGLRYHGRFAGDPDGVTEQRVIEGYLRRSTVVLASSSLATPAPYSHPTRDYLTARFTDAAVCGLRIAGARNCGHAAALIPEQVWLDIDVSDRDAAMARIAQSLGEHSPAAARTLALEAALTLDWRTRLLDIGRTMGADTALIEAELSQLEALTGAAAKHLPHSPHGLPI